MAAAATRITQGATILDGHDADVSLASLDDPALQHQVWGLPL
jgi:hypothetical protein